MTEDTSTDESEENSSRFSVKARWIAFAVLLLITIGGTLAYWQYRVYYPSTENAYVGSNIVRVASQVSGPVAHLYVVTDEHVKAGDPLFDIDPGLYQAALRAAEADFDAAAAASGTAGDNLKAAAKTLNDKREALDAALATYRKAKDAEAPGAAPSQTLTDASQKWHDAMQAYKTAEDDFVKAQNANITVATPTVKLRAAAAQLQKAEHELMATHVTAPGGGFLSTVSIRPGSIVAAGHPVFAIIEGKHWWVDANFKETEISRIHPGQSASIELDMYPGATFKGVVESISAGSGATFSVLPAENATGNWVKVTQRFPVRIRITNPDAYAGKQLRVGASASVTVDTTSDGSSAKSSSSQAAQ